MDDLWSTTGPPLTPGQWENVTFRIKNTGSAAATSRFYTKVWVGSTLIGTWYNNSLNAGYSATGSKNVRVSSSGNYAVKGTTDYYDAISESNEGNNSRTETWTWGGGWKLPWQGNGNFTGGPHVFTIGPNATCNVLTNKVPSGLDFSGANTVLAIDAGTVVAASSNLETFCGYDVKIRHGNYVVGYMHMKPPPGGVRWTPGQTVQQGKKVGETQACGGWTQHLHLELYETNGTTRKSWDGMQIDGYTVHKIYRISDGQIHNYEGSMTKGTEDPKTVNMCGNLGQAKLLISKSPNTTTTAYTAIADTGSSGCYGKEDDSTKICKGRTLNSTNTLR